MLYKFIDESRVQKCPKNGIVEGRAISNLPRYLENHREIAEKEGYKPLLIASKQPEIDSERQYVVPRYADNEKQIICHWEIQEFPTDIE